DVDTGRDDYDRRPLLEQRDRPVLHLAGRVGLRRDVGDLLELERTLQRHRQAYVATEVEEERPIVEALGNLLDRVVAVEEALHLLREVVDLVEDELDLA